MTRLSLFIAALLVIIWLAGCGANNTNNLANASAPGGTSRATITMHWPAPSRLIPAASGSIVVTANGPFGYQQSQTMVRPSGGGNTSATFDPLPLGVITFTASAYPSADGSGVAQATDKVAQTAVANTPLQVNLTMNSTIEQVAITPLLPQVVVGQTQQLTATAYDGMGNVVMVPSTDAFGWATSNQSVATVNVDSGIVTGVGLGSTSVTATERESGVVANSIITVIPPGTVTLFANPSTMTAGNSTTLNWTSTEASTVVNSNFGASGASGASGSISVSPTTTTIYSITVQGIGGTETATVKVTVQPAPPPTLTLTAMPTTITAGTPTTLSWTSSGAQTVTNSNFDAPSVSGTMIVTPTQTTTYTLTVQGPTGSQTASVTVTVNQPPTVALVATPSTIYNGGTSTLTWASTYATSATSNFGATTTSGSMSVMPTQTTTYIITVTGLGGSTTATATVTVNPPPLPTVTLTASPSTITDGNSCTLSWFSSQWATSVSNSNFGAPSVSGTLTVSPTSTTTYTITVQGVSGTATATATVTVNPPPPAPTLTLTASPQYLVAGNSSTLSWTTSGATAVTSSNFGALSLSGTMNVMPTQTTTYTMTVQGPGGSQTAQATVTIISGGVSVSITPNPVTIDVTKTAVFTATATNILNNLQNTAVTWMVVEPTGGSIVATGTNNGQCTALYTAPGIPGTYHVMATSVADPTQSAMATVTVQSGNAIITVQ